MNANDKALTGYFLLGAFTVEIGIYRLPAPCFQIFNGVVIMAAAFLAFAYNRREEAKRHDRNH